MGQVARTTAVLASLLFISLSLHSKCNMAQLIARIEYANSTDIVLNQLNTCYKANLNAPCRFIELKYGYYVFYYNDNDKCQTNANDTNTFVKYHRDATRATILIACSDLYTSTSNESGPPLVGSAIATYIMPSGYFYLDPVDDLDGVHIGVAGAGVCSPFNEHTKPVHWVLLKMGYNMLMYTSTNCNDDSLLFTFDEGFLQNKSTVKEQLKNGTNLLDPVNNVNYLGGNITDQVQELFQNIYSIQGIRVSPENISLLTPPPTKQEQKNFGMFYVNIFGMILYLTALLWIGILAFKKRLKSSKIGANGKGEGFVESASPRTPTTSDNSTSTPSHRTQPEKDNSSRVPSQRTLGDQDNSTNITSHTTLTTSDNSICTPSHRTQTDKDNSTRVPSQRTLTDKDNSTRVPNHGKLTDKDNTIRVSSRDIESPQDRTINPNEIEHQVTYDPPLNQSICIQ